MRGAMIGLAALVLAAAVGAADAAGAKGANGSNGGIEVQATLVGAAEVPSIATQARGTFTAHVFLDHIDYELLLQGFAANPNVAHIHLGQEHTNGGVMVFLCGNASTPACGVGTPIVGTIDAADVLGPAGQGVQAGEFEKVRHAILGGNAYVNAHTAQFPGGEIRGQVQLAADGDGDDEGDDEEDDDEEDDDDGGDDDDGDDDDGGQDDERPDRGRRR